MSRTVLFDKGWRRHSVISAYCDAIYNLIPLLPDTVQSIAKLPGSIVLVSTYDCAVVSDCFNTEPWVQILVAFPVAPNKEFFNGKNPRKIHFPVVHQNSELYFETGASCICQISRDFLLKAEPDLSYELSEKAKFQLKIWLADRFSQDTWPDAFNTAIEPSKKKLRNLWKRYNDFISGAYLKLDTYSEKQEGKYTASIILAMELGKKQSLIKYLKSHNPSLKEKSIDEILNHVVNELIIAFGDTVDLQIDPTTISKRAIEIVEEDEITVSQLKVFYRFSPYSLSEFNTDTPFPIDILPGRAI